MKNNQITLAAALAGLLLFSCSEDLDIKPDGAFDARVQAYSTGGTVSAMSATGADVIDFESLAKGTIVSEVYGKNGSGPVKVSAVNPRFPDRNAAMIFDSSAPSGADHDLGSPNRDFGGPGIGVGGEEGMPYQNTATLGKVLIITEDFDSNDPDDADLYGAEYTFDFSALTNVTVYSMDIMDVEAAENSATVTFYNAQGGMISRFSLPKVGDNGWYKFPFNAGVSGVVKMIVNLNGSGAIDNIVFNGTSVTPPPPAGTGCTFTQGYWKNHTKYSRAKRDATWDKIGAAGEDTPFFLSGQTYIEVMKTAPSGGNAYYILAHQYIAAKLNVLKGASYPQEVMDAITGAERLFNKYTPAEVGAMAASSSEREMFIEYASLLDQYNNGLIGPGHCD